MKILITGFDPFGGEEKNPAEETVNKINTNINGAKIIKVIIPTVRYKALKIIEEAIEEHKPDIVISIGQAGGRSNITIERIAINIDDYRIKDNEGNEPIDEKIKPEGETAYFSNLPIKAMVKHINDNGIPAAISNTAGTFVCNHVMYGLLYLVSNKYPNMKAGFIHIPYMTSQVVNKVNTPFMSLEEIAKGLELAIEACTLNYKDLNITGGTIC